MTSRGVQTQLTEEQVRALREERSRGFPPLDEWGPVCRGCGGDEYRIDGYCSIECRDWHNDEEFVALADAYLARQRVIEAADDFLRRLAEWDAWTMADQWPLGDAPYWKAEIAKVRAAVSIGSPETGKD